MLPCARVALLVALSGCASGRTLATDTGERRWIAHDTESALTVVLTSQAWDGTPRTLDQEVTVLHAYVRNDGRQPVRLAPQDFELRDGRGFRYELLDAGARFTAVGANDGPVDGGSEYAYIRSTDEDIGHAALPWGILRPGTSMRGYLYFEKLETTANRGTLTWVIPSAEDAASVELRFALRVAR